ncbi:hypothetical protein [Streptomyces mangrovisoli]|uniref:Secreted protein n=1 Tax=Streptomyces mangrovisoli TaxID=1428628 RepID=A0A1J4NKH8_9ACTN|nr:hypothetical protein [Streptomyces mangrovisoli]OIJ62760.1 hypothetical protein WN71_037770 [Streptomyces mangrovisoli]
MSRRTLATAVALTTTALLTAAMTTAAPAATRTVPAAHPAARQSGPTVLVDCAFHPKVKPAQFILACGDGNSRLGSLHWSHWGRYSASGSGVNVVNDCKPYCAAGKFHSYPVSVRLDSPRPWKAHPRELQYKQLTLTYTHGKPPGFPRVLTLPLWS